VWSVNRVGNPDRRDRLPAMRVVPLRDQHGLPSRLTGPATVWDTITPFIPPRRADRPSRWTPEFLHAQIAAELTDRGMPAPVQVAGLETPVRGWTTRRPSRPEWVPPPRHLRIVFDRPVSGPIAVGRLSHFGFGLFSPVKEP
jgi:CRISPR-associated protein Csb2